MRTSLLVAGVACALTTWTYSCADYGSSEGKRSDRLTLAGTVCSDDPADRSYPVKIMFVVDSSPDVAGLDAEGHRAQAVQDTLGRFSASSNHEFSVIHYGGRAVALTRGYTNRSDALTEAVAGLRQTLACVGDACRDWLGALTLARDTFFEDVRALHPATASRARYLFLFVASGPPQPPLETEAGCPEACRLAGVVEEISDFGDQAGVAGLEFHTVQLDDVPGLCVGTSEPTYCNSTYPCPDGNLCDDPNRVENDHTRALLDEMTAGVDSDPARFSIPAMLNFFYLDFSVEPVPLVPRTFLVTNRNAMLRGGEIVADSDGDGMSDREELQRSTDLARSDTDGDELGDLLESRMTDTGYDPLRPDRPAICDLDSPFPDSDGDGLNDCEETLLGTNPLLQDTDRDGYPDGTELRAGTNPVVRDSDQDLDHDGIGNGIELEVHLDPRAVDSSLGPLLAYRYETVPDDARPIPETGQPATMSGVRVTALSDRSIAGAGTLYYYPAGTLTPQGTVRSLPTLAWRDAADFSHGEEVAITASGTYLLFSACACRIACTGGCGPGEWCDPSTGSCGVDPCAMAVCTSQESCDHRTGRCRPDCSKSGCDQGMRCEPIAGMCIEDICDGQSCPGERQCNPEAGVCARPPCQAQECPQGLVVDTSYHPPWIVVEVDREGLTDNGAWCDGCVDNSPCATDTDCPASCPCRFREHLVVRAPEKTCIDFVVENIGLAQTVSAWPGAGEGSNRIQVMLGLHPEGHPDGHTVYRAADVEVRYLNGHREPDAPVIWLSDQDFLSVPESP